MGAVPANDNRIGGWQLMYQLLERDAWMIAENCPRLIECLPLLVRDDQRVEDVRKMEGDDAADAARYGLVPGVRYAGVGASAVGGPGAGQAPPDFGKGSVRFVPGIPVDVQNRAADHGGGSDFAGDPSAEVAGRGEEAVGTAGVWGKKEVTSVIEDRDQANHV